MIRPSLLIVALWAVILAPALCAAGVLAHECHCADEGVCDHEAECDVDPCADQILRKDESREIRAVEDGLGAAAVRPLFLIPAALGRGVGNPNAPPRSAPPPGAPHASDLPLLI